MQTFKHILRRMTRNPGFTTIALVTLMLGIGATTAVSASWRACSSSRCPTPTPTGSWASGTWRRESHHWAGVSTARPRWLHMR